MTKKKKTILTLAAAAALSVAAVLFVLADDTPNHKRMAALLTDMYMLDAVADKKGTIGNEKNRTYENTYHTMFEHHSITKLEYDSAMKWYSRHPDEYNDLYHDVIARLSERESNFLILFNQQDSIDKRIDFLRDSLRHDWWRISTTIRLPLLKEDTTTNPKLRFGVDNDTISGGTITLEMKHMFPYRNEARDTCNMLLIVNYANAEADTVSHKIIKRISQQAATIRYMVRDTVSAVRIEATLLDSKQLSNTTGTLSDIKFFYMPYEITDSIQVDEVIFPPLFPF